MGDLLAKSTDKKANTKKFMTLYKKGWNDAKIAAALGVSHVSIANRRYRRGLVANCRDIKGFRLTLKGVNRRAEKDRKTHRNWLARDKKKRKALARRVWS